jgi:predicted lysophospholipase L1 biosynthesis ABC-type transport system permease subunit
MQTSYCTRHISFKVTPNGTTGVTRSYFFSLGSLTYFVVGFMGGTYALGNFIRYDASSLGVFSCTGVDARLVCRFFIYVWTLLHLVAPWISATFLCLQLTQLSVLFECPNKNNPCTSPPIFFYMLFPIFLFLFVLKFAVQSNVLHIQF